MAEPIVLTLDKLPEKFDIEAIKAEAEKVVSLRKKHAGVVKEYAKSLINYGKDLSEWLLYLEKNLPTDHPNSKDENIDTKEGKTISLVELCKRTRILYDKVTNELATLENRFRNKKILVTSIGKARQGKSLLTQLYTGNRQIIKVQGTAQDCTGSVCVLHHDGAMRADEFKADVHFYTKHEALEALKDLLSSIRDMDDNFATGIIPIDINSFDDVQIVINDGEKQKKLKKLTTPKGVSLGQLNTLINYFSNSDYISCLSDNEDAHEVFENNITKLEEYNYIPSPHPKYLAVKRIDLTTNLGLEGLFEYFEIADTRGASDTSGSANDDIYSAIQESDAVFSIHRQDKGTLELGFYDTALNCFKNKESFIRKHFVIINEQFYPSMQTPSKNEDEVSISMCLDQIKKYALTNVFYVGQLYNEDNPEIPKEFANRLMVDMLSKIASQVRSLDQDRIDECNEDMNKLFIYLNMLQIELNKLVLFTQFDKEFFVKKFIDNLAGEIGKILLEEETSLGYNGGMQPDYNKLKEQRDLSIVTLSDIILGRRIEPKDDNINTIVPIFIDESRKKVETVYPHSADSDWIGEYLTYFARICFGQIEKNLYESTKEKIVDIKPEKDKLFKMIWDYSKIGVIFEEELPGEKAKNETCDFVSRLVEMYFETKHDSIKIPEDIPTPYQLLATYFKSAPEKLDEKSNVSRKSIIADELLQQKMIQLIAGIRLEEFVKKGLIDSRSVVQLLLQNLENFFKNIYSTDCIKFYLEHSNVVTSENPEYEEKDALCDRDKKILDRKEKVFGTIRDILAMDKLKLPKTSNAKESDMD